MRKNQSRRALLRKWPGTSEGWFHWEQGDTVILEFSIGTDSSVNPLLWERGRKEVEKQKVFSPGCSS